LALHGYHDSHGHFPPWIPATVWKAEQYHSISWTARILAQIGEAHLAAATVEANRVAPYGIRNNPPHIGLATVIKVYVCPADSRLSAPVTDPNGFIVAMTDYIGAFGPRGSVVGDPRGRRMVDIRDGTSQTILLGERPPPATFQAGRWYTFISFDLPGGVERFYGPDAVLYVTGESLLLGDPCRQPLHFGPGVVGNPCDRHHFWSLHGGGSNFSMADGSVRWLTYGSHDLVVAMTSVAGGEVVNLD